METIADLKEHLAKQSAALKLAREAIDWCVAEINRDSPSVMNGRKALAAIDALGEAQ